MNEPIRSYAPQEQPGDSVEIEVHTDRNGNVPISTVVALMKRVRELGTVLGDIEWIKNEFGQQYCPSCRRFRPYNHDKDCKLATVLKGN